MRVAIEVKRFFVKTKKVNPKTGKPVMVPIFHRSLTLDPQSETPVRFVRTVRGGDAMYSDSRNWETRARDARKGQTESLRVKTGRSLTEAEFRKELSRMMPRAGDIVFGVLLTSPESVTYDI